MDTENSPSWNMVEVADVWHGRAPLEVGMLNETFTGFGTSSSTITHVYRDCTVLGRARWVSQRNKWMTSRSWTKSTHICKKCLRRANEDSHPVARWDKALVAADLVSDFAHVKRRVDDGVTDVLKSTSYHITKSDASRAYVAIAEASASIPKLQDLWDAMKDVVTEVSNMDETAHSAEHLQAQSRALAVWYSYRFSGGMGRGGEENSNLFLINRSSERGGVDYDIASHLYLDVADMLTSTQLAVGDITAQHLLDAADAYVDKHVGPNDIMLQSLPDTVGTESAPERREHETSAEWLYRVWRAAVHEELARRSEHWMDNINRSMRETDVMCQLTIPEDGYALRVIGGRLLGPWGYARKGRKRVYTVPAAVAGQVLAMANDGEYVGIGEHTVVVQVAKELHRVGNVDNGDMVAAIETARLAL